MIRVNSPVAKFFSVFLCTAVVNMSVPMGGLVAFASNRGAPEPDRTPKPLDPSLVMSAKVQRAHQGKAGKNPYLAGQMKWAVVKNGVDITTGNFATGATDINFEGGYGIPVNVTRSYSANNDEEGPLGVGWTISVDVRNTAGGLLKSGGAPVRSVPLNVREKHSLENDPRLPDANEPTQGVVATDASGMEETIQRDADGILTTPPWDKNKAEPEYETVTLNNSTYQVLLRTTMKTPEGTTYVYEKKGFYTTGAKPWSDTAPASEPSNVLKPITATDRHGNVTTYSYGTSDVTFTRSGGSVTEKPITSILMPNGHQLNFTWTGNRITAASDGTRTVGYGYTGGLLTSVTSPGGKTTSYGYGGASATQDWVNAQLPVAGALLTSITDPRGLQTTIEYEMGFIGVAPGLGTTLGPLARKVNDPNGVTHWFGYGTLANGSIYHAFTDYYGNDTNEMGVSEMLTAAQSHGALVLEHGEWVIVNWRAFQEVDPTARNRKSRFLAKQRNDSDEAAARASSQAPVNGNSGTRPSKTRTAGTNSGTERTEGTRSFELCPVPLSRDKDNDNDIDIDIDIDVDAVEDSRSVPVRDLPVGPTNPNMDGRQSEILAATEHQEIDSTRSKDSMHVWVRDLLLYVRDRSGRKLAIDSDKPAAKHLRALWRNWHQSDIERLTYSARQVVDLKVAQWGQDDTMRPYLRPETLFGEKFQTYVTEAEEWHERGRPTFVQGRQRSTTITDIAIATGALAVPDIDVSAFFGGAA